MTWSTGQASTEESAIPRVVRGLNAIAAWGLMVLAVMVLVSLILSDFVPSAMTVRVAKLLTILVGLFYAAFFLGIGRFGWDPLKPQVASAMDTSRALRKAYIRVPFMSVVFTFFAWMSFSSGIPWALNFVAGSEASITVVVDGWDKGSSRSCSRPTLQNVPPFMLGRRALCFGRDHSKAEFPVGASLVLKGRSSIFGISPESYRVRRPAPLDSP